MSDYSFLSGTRTGTLTGTFLVVLSTIQPGDILETSLVAAVGASVSFIVSLVMKRLFKKRKK